MHPIFYTAGVGVAWQVSRQKAGLSLAPRFTCRATSWMTWAGAVALPLAFLVHLALLYVQGEQHDHMPADWFARLPLRLVTEPPFSKSATQTAFSNGSLACVVVETLGLLALCLGPARTRPERALPWLAGAALAILAVVCPVLTSSDVYYATVASTLGFHVYAPAHDAIAPQYRFLAEHVQLEGSIYGPLWIVINGAVGALGQTLLAKIVALRCLGAVFIVLGTLALQKLAFPRSIVLAFACNPMLWLYVVANCHNDILAIVPCIAAIGSSTAIAVCLVAAAGCIKLPFLLVGIVAFARLPPLRAFGAISASVLICLIASWVFGGRPYINDLFGYSHLRGHAVVVPLKHWSELGMQIFALLCLPLAVFFRRYFIGSAWLLATLFPFVFPWYLLWGLPYAVAARTGLLAILVLLPLGATVIDGIYTFDIPLLLGIPAALFAIDMYFITRRRRVLF